MQVASVGSIQRSVQCASHLPLLKESRPLGLGVVEYHNIRAQVNLLGHTTHLQLALREHTTTRGFHAPTKPTMNGTSTMASRSATFTGATTVVPSTTAYAG